MPPKINFQQLTNSRLGVGFALGVGRSLPPPIGYALANWIADRVAGRKKTGMVQAVRANRFVVSGGQLTSSELDRCAHETLRHTGRCLYDYYHNLHDPAAIQKMVIIDPGIAGLLEHNRTGQQPMLVVVPHMSNFDLVGSAMAMNGNRMQVLSFPTPTSGYRWQNQLRTSLGIEVTPMSIAALRQATQTLTQGGLVVTGLDRPVIDSKYCPRFFGRPAALPVAHIRLALKLSIPIVVAASILKPDGKYHLVGSEPIEMRSHPDLETEIIQNAETILAVVEKWIQEYPNQWAMFYPVWPEVLHEIH